MKKKFNRFIIVSSLYLLLTFLLASLSPILAFSCGDVDISVSGTSGQVTISNLQSLHNQDPNQEYKIYVIPNTGSPLIWPQCIDVSQNTVIKTFSLTENQLGKTFTFFIAKKGLACFMPPPVFSIICSKSFVPSDIINGGGGSSYIPEEKRCPSGNMGLDTAIGCIPTEIGPLAQYILTRGISIGGGVAFLLMLFGAFTIITSAGNPESTKKGQEMITSAITGLLFIIFSVFLLKVIGIDILGLDQFGVFQ